MRITPSALSGEGVIFWGVFLSFHFFLIFFIHLLF